MLGLAIGAVAVAAAVMAVKRHRRRSAYYGAYYGACGGADFTRDFTPWEPRGFGFRHHHHHHYNGGFRRSRYGMLRGIFARLDTTPGQEKAIVTLLAEARERFKSHKLGFKDARRDIAAIFGSDVLDQGALEALIAERRATLDDMTKEFVRTVATLHDVLDTRQRRELSELLADGSLGPSMRPRYDF